MVELLIIRHAIARDKVKFARTGRPDSERPLTAKGREKFRKAARGLRRIAPRVEVLATSPYARAMQTCDILSRRYKGASVTRLNDLRPGGDPKSFTSWLALRKETRVAVVGHEPDLGRLVAHLTGSKRPALDFKKGGAALVLFEKRPAAGAGRLQWLLTPAFLQRLKK